MGHGNVLVLAFCNLGATNLHIPSTATCRTVVPTSGRLHRVPPAMDGGELPHHLSAATYWTWLPRDILALLLSAVGYHAGVSQLLHSYSKTCGSISGKRARGVPSE